MKIQIKTMVEKYHCYFFDLKKTAGSVASGFGKVIIC